MLRVGWRVRRICEVLIVLRCVMGNHCQIEFFGIALHFFYLLSAWAWILKVLLGCGFL